MAQSRESSGLLSLAALRSDAERSQRQAELARAEAEQRARAAAERARAEELRAHEERQRERERATDAARRAELAELDRVRLTELARAEHEARARRDLELSLAEERLTWRQAEVRLTARVARARLFNSLSGAVCVTTWLAMFALYFGVIRPDGERTRGALDHAMLSERQARDEAAAAATRANQREAALSERVSSLEQALREARARSEPVPASTAEKRSHVGATHGARPPDTSPRACVDDGDPLNSCLKH